MCGTMTFRRDSSGTGTSSSLRSAPLLPLPSASPPVIRITSLSSHPIYLWRGPSVATPGELLCTRGVHPALVGGLANRPQ